MTAMLHTGPDAGATCPPTLLGAGRGTGRRRHLASGQAHLSFPVRALSRHLRGGFVSRLRAAFEAGRLERITDPQRSRSRAADTDEQGMGGLLQALPRARRDGGGLPRSLHPSHGGLRWAIAQLRRHLRRAQLQGLRRRQPAQGHDVLARSCCAGFCCMSCPKASCVSRHFGFSSPIAAWAKCLVAIRSASAGCAAARARGEA